MAALPGAESEAAGWNLLLGRIAPPTSKTVWGSGGGAGPPTSGATHITCLRTWSYRRSLLGAHAAWGMYQMARACIRLFSATHGFSSLLSLSRPAHVDVRVGMDYK